MRKLKFFGLGLIPGLLLVAFILNKKGASCSGYLPNSRVIAETLSKKAVYSTAFKNEMEALKISEQFLRDSIMTKGKVDFDKSQAQKEPCPSYTLQYPDKNPRLEIQFEKCAEEANFFQLRKLR